MDLVFLGEGHNNNDERMGALRFENKKLLFSEFKKITSLTLLPSLKLVTPEPFQTCPVTGSLFFSASLLQSAS